MVANALFLLNNGIYFDTVFENYMTDKELIDHATCLGKPWSGYLQALLLPVDISGNAVYLYKLVPFVCLLFSAFFLNEILKKIKEIPPPSRLVITLFFALFPVAPLVKVFFGVMDYVICYFLFFLSFYLVPQRASLIIRIASNFLFFCSFLNAALLPFYSIVLIYLFYEFYGNNAKNIVESIKNEKFIDKTRNFIYTHLDYIVLPILFWIIKAVLFKPYGFAANYNHVNYKCILGLPLYLPRLIYNNLIDVLMVSWESLFVGGIIIFFLYVVVFSFSFFILKEYFKFNVPDRADKKDYAFFLFGLLAFAVGVLPFVAITKFPQSYYFLCRLQLLIPLGISFLLFYGVKIPLSVCTGISKQNATYFLCFVYSFLITIFTASGINNAIEFHIYWYKQLSLIENFKEESVMKDHTTFLFVDNTRHLDAKKRALSGEYVGFLTEATGSREKLGLDFDEFMGWVKNYYKKRGGLADYNKQFIPNSRLSEEPPSGYDYSAIRVMDGYSPKYPECIVIINPGKFKINSYMDYFKLVVLQFLNTRRFKENIKQIVDIEIKGIKIPFEEMISQAVNQESLTKNKAKNIKLNVWYKFYLFLKAKGLTN